jgi:hypothetical protein
MTELMTRTVGSNSTPYWGWHKRARDGGGAWPWKIMIDHDKGRSSTPLAWIGRVLRVLYSEPNTILLFFTSNNHTSVLFGRVLFTCHLLGIPSSSPLTLSESCSCFPSLPYLSPHLQVKCDIHTPDSTTPLSMEPLLFSTAMTSSGMLSRSLPQQVVYATSVPCR